MKMCTSRSSFSLPKIRTNYGKLSLIYNGPKIWNSIAEQFKSFTLLLSILASRHSIIITFSIITLS